MKSVPSRDAFCIYTHIRIQSTQGRIGQDRKMTERTLPRRLMQSETLGDGVAVFPGNFESDPLYGHIRHSDPGHPLGIDQPSTVDAYEPIVQQTLPLRIRVRVG